MDSVLETAKYVSIVVIGLLPIMNPLSTVPLYLALTRSMSAQHKRQQAFRSCLFAFVILATFLMLGNAIITLFGISLAGIRVAGGMIILVLAFRMLFSGDSDASTVNAGPDEIKQAELDFSFSPLAMPSLSGPGSIAVVMSFGSQIPAQNTVYGHIVVLVGTLICVGLAYAALRGADWVARFLGPHGIQAVTKIMGFLLTCVAIQLIANGVHDFIKTLN